MNTKQTSTISNKKSKPLTFDSMFLSIKKLEFETKIEKMFVNGKEPIAYFPKHFKRPKWVIELLHKNKIPMKRSTYVEDRHIYLIDMNMNSFWTNHTPLL